MLLLSNIHQPNPGGKLLHVLSEQTCNKEKGYGRAYLVITYAI
jgi:hypothetical protein